jgi:hypothetical protein
VSQENRLGHSCGDGFQGSLLAALHPAHGFMQHRLIQGLEHSSSRNQDAKKDCTHLGPFL